MYLSLADSIPLCELQQRKFENVDSQCFERNLYVLLHGLYINFSEINTYFPKEKLQMFLWFQELAFLCV